MTNTDEKDIYIDPDIPAEQQITFLRQHAITCKVDAYEVLKDGGEEGIEVFKNILRKGYKRITEMTEKLDFQMLESLAGFSDKMMGLQTEMDYSNLDEFQYSISYCPYLEECKRRGLGMEFCHVFEDVYMEEINKNIGGFTEPSRMCDGDKKCTFRMKNTFK